MQVVNISENTEVSENTKMYVVWMGTKDNLKMRKHNKVLSKIELMRLSNV